MMAAEVHQYQWALTLENLSSGFANSKGADQTAQKCSLISAFAIRLFNYIRSKLQQAKLQFSS